MAPKRQNGTAAPEGEVYGAFSAILDEVNRMFSIGSIGKWFAMNRVRSHGVPETLDFMQRVAAHGFNAVVTPGEREVLHRALRGLEIPAEDQETWDRLLGKLRRMKMAR